MSALTTKLIENGWWDVIEQGIMYGAIITLVLGAALIWDFYYSTMDWRE